MAYDFEEQEKLDRLKSWWAANGTTLLLAIAVFAAAIAGNRWWNYYQGEQARQAADLYTVLQQQVERGNDLVKVKDATQLLTEGFSGSGYASRAALVAARTAVLAGDTKSATEMLQWILDHVSEPEIKDIARLRLAGVLLDGKQYDQVLALLNTQNGASFAGLYADYRGDALAATGKANEARSAYQLALDNLGGQSVYRNAIQMKMDVLHEQQ